MDEVLNNFHFKNKMIKHKFVTSEIGKICHFEKRQIFQLTPKMSLGWQQSKYHNNKNYVIIFLNKF